MHGGLFSEDGVTLEAIKKTNRNKQPPDSGMIVFFSIIHITKSKAKSHLFL